MKPARISYIMVTILAEMQPGVFQQFPEADTYAEKLLAMVEQMPVSSVEEVRTHLATGERNREVRTLLAFGIGPLLMPTRPPKRERVLH